MKKILVSLLITISLYAHGWDTEQVLRDIEYLSTTYPRLEGSYHEKRAIDYIRRRLDSAGVAVESLQFDETAVAHSYSAVLDVTIPGKLQDLLILAVPLGHAVDAPRERDGSAAISLALAVVDELHGSCPPVTVKVLFLGAEHDPEGQSSGTYPIGSRLFLRDFFPDSRAAVVYLDLETIPSRVFLRCGANRAVAPFWLIRRITDAFSDAGVFFRIRGNENQVFRMGASTHEPRIGAYLHAGYPAIALQGEYRAQSDSEARHWVSAFGAFVNSLLASFSGGVPEEWDRHYLLFQVRGLYFRIAEGVYLSIFVAALAVALAYGVVATRRLSRYARAVARGGWVIPLLVGGVFVALYAATMALTFLMALLNFPSLWQYRALAFAGLKICLTGVILALARPVLSAMPLPKNGNFYSATAILLLLCIVVCVGMFEFSLTYYFLWAFLFCMLSVMSRRRWLKILLALPAPYWLVKAVGEFFQMGEEGFIRWVLVERVWGNLLIAAAVVPFGLLARRLTMLFRRGHRQTRFSRLVMPVALLSAGCAFAVGIALNRPFTGEAPQPLVARAVFDYTTDSGYLELTSPTAIGSITVSSGGSQVTSTTGDRTHTIAVAQPLPPFSVSSSSEAFLDRRNVHIRLLGSDDLTPYQVQFVLRSAGEYILYDANYPVSRSPSGTEYTIEVGISPPHPFELELTLPQHRTFQLAILAEYLEFPSTMHLSAGSAEIVRRMTVLETYEFET